MLQGLLDGSRGPAGVVRPGAVRIASTIPGRLNNVAFKGPGAAMALIVQNDEKTPQTFAIRYRGKAGTASLKAESVGTFVWK